MLSCSHAHDQHLPQILVADTGNHVVRKIDVGSAMTSTLAGAAGMAGYQDGMGVDAR